MKSESYVTIHEVSVIPNSILISPIHDRVYLSSNSIVQMYSMNITLLGVPYHFGHVRKLDSDT